MVPTLDEDVPPVPKHRIDTPEEASMSRACPEAPMHLSTSACNKTRMAKMALSIDTTSVIGRPSRSISPFNLVLGQNSDPPRLASRSPPTNSTVRAIRAREPEPQTVWIPYNPEYESDTEEATSGCRSDLGSIEMEDLLDSSGDEEENSSQSVPGAGVFDGAVLRI